MFALVLLGVAYRVALTARLGVGYDEVFVIAVGLLDMEASSAARVVETPMTRSSGTAPLWWWVEYAAYRAAGEVSLTALRAAPAALGLAALPLGWWLVRRRFGRRVAGVFVALMACSDVLAFLNSRSDFFESLMMIFMLPVVASAGARQRGWLRGLLWAGMALTFLGKAIFVIGLCGLAELVATACAPAQRLARLKSLVISTMVAAAPVMAWLLFAQAHFAGQPIVHEATTAGSVWELVRSLTADYAQTKAHVTGTWRDALQVWLDGRVWSWNVLLIVPAITAVVWAARGTLRGLRSGGGAKACGWPRRRVAALTLAVWSVVGLAIIASRGTAGARFHVLYLPALWLLIALALSSRGLRRRLINVPWLLAAGVVPAATLAWLSWYERAWSLAAFAGWAVVIAGLALLAFWSRSRPPTGTLPRRGDIRRCVGGGALVAGLVGLALWTGPLRWAPFAEFEPMYGPDGGTKSLKTLDALTSGRVDDVAARRETVYLLLANYYYTRHLSGKPLKYIDRPLEMAERFATQATLDRPADEAGWFYLGLVYDAQGRSAEERRSVWRRALELKPDSARIHERLDAVRD